ncbi:hypothetical protein Tco_0665708, partial [Tanacetum coccineum]
LVSQASPKSQRGKIVILKIRKFSDVTLGESLSSVPDAYGQSLEALPSQPAASGNESHIPGVVSE